MNALECTLLCALNMGDIKHSPHTCSTGRKCKHNTYVQHLWNVHDVSVRVLVCLCSYVQCDERHQQRQSFLASPRVVIPYFLFCFLGSVDDTHITHHTHAPIATPRTMYMASICTAVWCTICCRKHTHGRHRKAHRVLLLRWELIRLTCGVCRVAFIVYCTTFGSTAGLIKPICIVNAWLHAFNEQTHSLIHKYDARGLYNLAPYDVPEIPTLRWVFV